MTMPKELLKIVRIKDNVCEIKYDGEDLHDDQTVAASICSLMLQRPAFGKTLMQYIATTMANRKEFSKVIEESRMMGKKKLEN